MTKAAAKPATLWHTVWFSNAASTSTSVVRCIHLERCPHTVYKGVQGR